MAFTVEGDNLKHEYLTSDILACTENVKGETHILVRYRDRRSVGGINFFNKLYVSHNRLAWREIPRPSAALVNTLANAHGGAVTSYRRIEYRGVAIQDVLPNGVLSLA